MHFDTKNVTAFFGRFTYSASALGASLVITLFSFASGPVWVFANLPACEFDNGLIENCSIGLPVDAPALTFVSDTLTDSDLGASSNHTIKATLYSALTAGTELIIAFDAAFNLNGIDFNDIDLAGSASGEQTLAATASGATWGVAISGQEVTFTSGTATFNAGETLTIEIGTNATTGATGDTQIINPSVTGSYPIIVINGISDVGYARVAIIDDVVVTASVDTTLDFVVSGVASGQTGANEEGTNTSVTTTASTIPWGTIAPGTPKVARHDLAVTTNANNGFTVTLFQDQNLTSATGADIDQFRDGTNGAPQAWAAPTGTLDDENTYGHMGVTSSDSSLSTGDTFGATLYDAIGTGLLPIEVFYHAGPADGSTAHKGATEIGYKIETTDLQEAGTDYTSTLTYIVTPIF